MLLEIVRCIEDDPRYQVFSDVPIPLSLKVTSDERNDPYWKCCLCCGRTNEEISICPAIILSANPLFYENFTCFGEGYGYENGLDITSVRNCIPLCGSSGTTGTCRCAFDKFELSLLYDPFMPKFYFIDEYYVKY
jgi:hypothetical protein